MFSDLQNDLDNFYDLSDDQQNLLLEEIVKRAEQDKSGFEEYLSTIPYGTMSTKSIFYEAIWKQPKNWGDFAFRELSKLIEEAERGNEEAIQDLMVLPFLVSLNGMTESYYKRTSFFLTRKLKSKIPAVREDCLVMILDIAESYNIPLERNQKSALQKLLLDPEFNIRIYAYSRLKELNLIPKRFKIPMLDKIRAKLTGKSSYLE